MGMTKWAYRELIQSDIAWLLEQPNSLERIHILAVLNKAVDHEYPTEVEGSKVGAFRPIPVSRIKNNFLRKVGIVLAYIPIIALSTIVNAVRAVWWFLKCVVFACTTLWQSACEHWDNPRDD